MKERNTCSASVPEMLPVPSRRAFTQSSTLFRFSEDAHVGNLGLILFVLF